MADSEPVYFVAASPDGTRLATSGPTPDVKVWDTATKAVVQTLSHTKGPIGSPAFSADGRLLATASQSDGLLWVWRWDAEEAVLVIPEAADNCTLEAVAFHPNGKYVAVGGLDWLATSGNDGALCVWDLEARDKLLTLEAGVTAVDVRRDRPLPGGGDVQPDRPVGGRVGLRQAGEGVRPARAPRPDQRGGVLAGRELAGVGRGRLDGPGVERADGPAGGGPPVRRGGAVAGVQPGRQVPVHRQRQHDGLPARNEEDARRVAVENEPRITFSGRPSGSPACVWGHRRGNNVVGPGIMARIPLRAADATEP